MLSVRIVDCYILENSGIYSNIFIPNTIFIKYSNKTICTRIFAVEINGQEKFTCMFNKRGDFNMNGNMDVPGCNIDVTVCNIDVSVFNMDFPCCNIDVPVCNIDAPVFNINFPCCNMEVPDCNTDTNLQYGCNGL